MIRHTFDPDEPCSCGRQHKSSSKRRPRAPKPTARKRCTRCTNIAVGGFKRCAKCREFDRKKRAARAK